jgi:hypothetical protein
VLEKEVLPSIETQEALGSPHAMLSILLPGTSTLNPAASQLTARLSVRQEIVGSALSQTLLQAG